MIRNNLKMAIPATSLNEAFSRNVIAAFCLPLDPTLDWLSDVKTAVSEAVTNCIVHAYKDSGEGVIEIDATITNDGLDITIKDKGVGIANVDEAMQPFYTTKGGMERSGMGFTVMQTFMDSLDTVSNLGEGTTVHMTKKIMCGGDNA